jgi:hypothetical protein
MPGKNPANVGILSIVVYNTQDSSHLLITTGSEKKKMERKTKPQIPLET